MASVTGDVISVDESKIRGHVDEVVRTSVEETLNGLLDAEADQLCGAKRYERSADRVDTRAGSYDRKLQTKAGEVNLKVPRLRSLPFETQIIERYRRRESSVEEALMEMYLAGVSVRRVEDITEALWGTRVSPSAVSDLNQKLYERIEQWRNRPIEGEYAYIALDGIWLKRSWGGEVKNVAVLVAIGVDQKGYRQVLGVCEGTKEDIESWKSFLRHLKERGLKGVQLVTSDKCLGLVDSLAEFYPESAWQRCMVHWYRNVASSVPTSKMKEVMAMLKAIHAQEDREAAEKKATDVVAKLQVMKLAKASRCVEEGASETLSYMAFPREHWTRIRTNNPLERIMREIRRRTRVVGAFPDGNSALMLVAARLRHIAGTKWGTRKYLDMSRLADQQKESEQQEGTEAVA
ncbi:IS256 family transposase [Adhaeretor mobilis]|uniref:Mutator family transposase n=1 Tax=Adhaeretor mobilis TaxID=1930276 RepID=A0A517MW51_9BACT|nr:IS256 family transposase [Adhaeretor mobilis]QDS99111.1 Transposase, Mutator family [Adhaeretor mobilis]QDS99304.1 Transposase, Mutator family [Adhaeretor mobilis]